MGEDDIDYVYTVWKVILTHLIKVTVTIIAQYLTRTDNTGLQERHIHVHKLTHIHHMHTHALSTAHTHIRTLS